MTFVLGFLPGTPAGKLHPTSVTATYRKVELPDGRALLQLDTHGSEKREVVGKRSQTLQFDEQSAAALMRILADAFPLDVHEG